MLEHDAMHTLPDDELDEDELEEEPEDEMQVKKAVLQILVPEIQQAGSLLKQLTISDGTKHDGVLFPEH